MIVVSDTTALNYLILVHCIDVLPALFSKVYAPGTVVDELKHIRSPDKVATWAQSPPAWLTFRIPRLGYPQLRALDQANPMQFHLPKNLEYNMYSWMSALAGRLQLWKDCSPYRP